MLRRPAIVYDEQIIESLPLGLKVRFIYFFLDLPTPGNKASMLPLYYMPSWGKRSERKGCELGKEGKPTQQCITKLPFTKNLPA